MESSRTYLHKTLLNSKDRDASKAFWVEKLKPDEVPWTIYNPRFIFLKSCLWADAKNCLSTKHRFKSVFVLYNIRVFQYYDGNICIKKN